MSGRNPNIFPFLELPRELRQIIYEYALVSAYGLCMDVYRRDLPKVMEKRGTKPPACVVQAQLTSVRGVVTPELLNTCRLVRAEARWLIWQNQMRLDRFSWQGLDHIPWVVTQSISSLYIGDGTQTLPVLIDGSKPTDPRHLRFERYEVMRRFTMLKHVTIHLPLEDPGLLGKEEFAKDFDREFERKSIPFRIIAQWANRFKEGRLRTVNLECGITYPSDVYPYVYIWAWVQNLAPRILLRAKMEVWDLYGQVDDFAGRPCDSIARWVQGVPRQYKAFTKPDPSCADKIQLLYGKIKAMWNRFGIEITARDPTRFERGTILEFRNIQN